MRGFRSGLTVLLLLGALSFGACSDSDEPETTAAATGPGISAVAATSTSANSDALEAANFAVQRQRLIEEIGLCGVTESRVLEAMGVVERHHFVPERYRDLAYRDRPLPIGEGQTISQPFVVGLMTQLLDVEPGDRVLEVGTGSGYQAAVLEEMGVEVYSIEIISVLAKSARERLDRLGYDEVETRTADGYLGWPDAAPFDGVIVTAAPDHFPPPLREQLKPTGRMVIPVGPTGSVQTLWLVEQREGEWVFVNQGDVTFVPLVR